MKLNIVKPHGFCEGVKRILKIIKKQSSNNEPVYLYYEPIHNKTVSKELQKSVLIIKDKKKFLSLPKGVIITSAHGLAKEDEAFFKNLNHKLIEGTCPFVKLSLQKILFYKKDHEVIYFGNHHHQEANYILSYNPNIYFIESLSDAYLLPCFNNPVLISQTTSDYFLFLEIKKYLLKKYQNLKVLSVCDATKKRQEAFFNALTSESLGLVVGDETSRNANMLVEIGNKKTKTLLIDSNSLLEPIIKINGNIVITASASTPENEFQKVINKITELTKK